MPSHIQPAWRKLARRWLQAWSLLLILAYLPIPAAQAAPAEKPQQKRTYTFSLTASVTAGREGAPVCVGETVSFSVRAWRSAVDSIDSHRDIAIQPAFNVKIDALSLKADVLQVQGPASLRTRFDYELPGEAEFTFKARKEGRAEVVFEALFPARMVDPETRQGLSEADLRSTLYAEVRKTVDVIECPLDVTAMIQYQVSYPGGEQQFISIVSDARLVKSGQDDGLFVYEGLETVVLTERPPDCEVNWKKSERVVTIEARRLDKHYRLKIERGPLLMEITQKCPEGENTASVAVPHAGVQELNVPLRGGSYNGSKRMPMTSIWWVVQAKARTP